jgi:hypothetical protein
MMMHYYVDVVDKTGLLYLTAQAAANLNKEENKTVLTVTLGVETDMASLIHGREYIKQLWEADAIAKAANDIYSGTVTGS